MRASPTAVASPSTSTLTPSSSKSGEDKPLKAENGEPPKMRPVTFVPRSSPASSSSSTSVNAGTTDDYKFKKPLLPVKRRTSVVVDDKKKQEDVRKVQMFMQEATRKSQETVHRPAMKTMEVLKNQMRNKPLEDLLQGCTKETTKMSFHGELFDVPTIFVHSCAFFRSVINKDTFRSLSEEHKEHLKKFLPEYANKEEEDKILDTAFTTDKFVVKGNPIDTVQLRMKNGWYSPDRCNDHIHLRDSRKVMYDHYIRFYYMNLLQKLTVSRHLLLARFDSTSVRQIKENHPQPPLVTKDMTDKRTILVQLRRRAAKRARLMLTDVKQMVGENGFSSDEEEEDVGPTMPKVLLSNNCQRSTLYSRHVKDLDLHQPTQMDDVKTMLKKFMRLRRRDPKSPCLNFDGIKLDDVFDRAGILAQSEKIKQTVANLEREMRGGK